MPEFVNWYYLRDVRQTFMHLPLFRMQPKKMSIVQVSKLHTLTGHRDSVYTLEPSPEDALIFSGSGDGMVVAWNLADPETGSLIAKLPNSIYTMHYHAVSDALIVGHNYEGIHLLDWQNKNEIGSLQLTQAAIFDLKSHGHYLFVATGEGMVLKVDSKHLAITHRVQLSEKSARAIAVNEQRGEIAVGYSDNYIRVFDLDHLKLKHEWQAHANSVFTLQYTPDKKFLLSGSRDARLKMWDSYKYLYAGCRSGGAHVRHKSSCI